MRVYIFQNHIALPYSMWNTYNKIGTMKLRCRACLRIKNQKKEKNKNKKSKTIKTITKGLFLPDFRIFVYNFYGISSEVEKSNSP